MTELLVRPRDSIVVRDGRPFGAGQGHRMRPLSWLTPQTFAGSLRTWIGKHAGGFDKGIISQLLSVKIRGPLPAHEGTLFFPAPHDLVLKKGSSRALRVRPRPREAGIEIPSGVRQLCFPTPEQEEDFKPVDPPGFVSHQWMTQWLLDAETAAPAGTDILPKIEIDERSHVKVDPTSYAAEESFLFTTTGLSFAEDVGIAAQIETPLGLPLDSLHPLGGERRLAYWETTATPRAGWSCPEEIRAGLKDGACVRLVLASPGLFDDGWIPRWLHTGGHVPGTDVQLELIAASCPRWQPISGWNLRAGEFGAKPLRRLMPAGAVYFCRVTNRANAAELAARWLYSVADKPQDQNDGFGLALWGLWKEHYG